MQEQKKSVSWPPVLELRQLQCRLRKGRSARPTEMSVFLAFGFSPSFSMVSATVMRTCVRVVVVCPLRGPDGSKGRSAQCRCTSSTGTYHFCSFHSAISVNSPFCYLSPFSLSLILSPSLCRAAAGVSHSILLFHSLSDLGARYSLQHRLSAWCTLVSQACNRALSLCNSDSGVMSMPDCQI